MAALFQSIDDRSEFDLKRSLLQDSTSIYVTQLRNGSPEQPFLYAIKEGWLQGVEILSEFGCDSSLSAKSGIWLAVMHQHPDILQYLVKVESYSIDRPYDNLTPLYEASQKGYLDLVKILVQAGAHLDPIRAAEVSTPLYTASEYGHLPIVEYLFETRSFMMDQMYKGFNVFHVAVQHDRVEIMKFVLQHRPEMLHKRGPKGESVLSLAAMVRKWDAFLFLLETFVASGHPEAIDEPILFDSDLKVTVTEIPLLFAMQHGQTKIVQYLIQVGTKSINAIDRRGRTPLHLAANNPSVLQMVIETGANTISLLDNERCTPFHHAIVSADSLRLLFRLAKALDPKFELDGNLLYLAIRRRQPAAVAALINMGLRVDIPDPNQWQHQSPFSLAVQGGNIEIMEYLLQAQIRRLWHFQQRWSIRVPIEIEPFLNQSDDSKRTPLGIALADGKIDVVSTLISMSKSMLTLPVAQHRTPLSFLLKEYGANTIGREMAIIFRALHPVIDFPTDGFSIEAREWLEKPLEIDIVRSIRARFYFDVPLTKMLLRWA